MTLSSDNSVKFLSLQDLVAAELFLKKLLLCLERGTNWCTEKGDSNTFDVLLICYLMV